MTYKNFVLNQSELLKLARLALAHNDFKSFEDKMTKYNHLCSVYLSEKKTSCGLSFNSGDSKIE